MLENQSSQMENVIQSQQLLFQYFFSFSNFHFHKDASERPVDADWQFIGPCYSWSHYQDELLEQAPIAFPKDTPGRWDKEAGKVPRKSLVDVRQHYKDLFMTYRRSTQDELSFHVMRIMMTRGVGEESTERVRYHLGLSRERKVFSGQKRSTSKTNRFSVSSFLFSLPNKY